MSDLTDDFWGKPIYVYTRAQAIEDGVLADLTKLCPDICRQVFPGASVACTSTVWGLIERAVDNKKYGNDTNGVVWDILYMSRHFVTGRMSENTWLFKVIIKGAGRKSTYTLKLVGGADDDGVTPAITIMLPGED